MRPGAFTVLYFSAHQCRIGRFRWVKGKWTLWRFSEHQLTGDDPGKEWQQLLHDSGYRPVERLAVAGALADGIFYRCASVGMNAAAQRDAMELEMPRRIPFIPEKHILQFFDLPDRSDSGAATVNCYVFPGTSLDKLAAALGSARLRADNYLYPLLGLRPDDPVFFDASLENGYSFSGCSWHPVPEGTAAETAPWREKFADEFQLPDTPDFSLEAALPVLLTARIMARSDLAARLRALRVLPDKLRPVRFRRQIIVCTILAVVLLLIKLGGCAAGWSSNYRELNRRKAELAKITRRTGQMQSRLRAGAKRQKELNKLLNSAPGASGVIGKWAALSQALPSNVRVLSLHWSDSGVDLVLQSENDGGDLAEKLGQLPYWRIAQLQQRRGWNSAGSTITVKLESRDGEVRP